MKVVSAAYSDPMANSIGGTPDQYLVQGYLLWQHGGRFVKFVVPPAPAEGQQWYQGTRLAWVVVAWLLAVPLATFLIYFGVSTNSLADYNFAWLVVLTCVCFGVFILLLVSWFLDCGVQTDVFQRVLWSSDCWVLLTMQVIKNICWPLYMNASGFQIPYTVASVALVVVFLLLDAVDLNQSLVGLSIALICFMDSMVPSVRAMFMTETGNHLWFQEFNFLGQFPTTYHAVVRFQATLYLVTYTRVFWRSINGWRSNEELWHLRTPVIESFSRPSNDDVGDGILWEWLLIGVFPVVSVLSQLESHAWVQVLYSLALLVLVVSCGGLVYTRGFYRPALRLLARQISLWVALAMLCFNVYMDVSCAPDVNSPYLNAVRSVFWMLAVLAFVLTDALAVKSGRMIGIMLVCFTVMSLLNSYWYASWSQNHEKNCKVVDLKLFAGGALTMSLATAKVTMYMNCFFLLLPGMLFVVCQYVGWGQHHEAVMLFALTPVPRRKQVQELNERSIPFLQADTMSPVAPPNSAATSDDRSPVGRRAFLESPTSWDAATWQRMLGRMELSSLDVEVGDIQSKQSNSPTSGSEW